MAKDLHERPFDEGTLTKLYLYADYLRRWLPVFLRPSPRPFDTVNIFDFFAGPGADVEGNRGSPLITIDELEPYLEQVAAAGPRVNLYFNEYRRSKFNKLKQRLAKLHAPKHAFTVQCASREFQQAFDEWYPLMLEDRPANFLFLDQSGIKQITDGVFRKIVSLKGTDFLFFISSSTLYRFRDHPRIREHIKVPQTAVSAGDYYHIHRAVLDYYRALLPRGDEYYLSSFSIKKGANVYGLIFGSSHLLGIEKFLRSCWTADPQRGEANFDIDRERIQPGQQYLIPDMGKPKKLQLFEEQLASEILGKRITTNREIYVYTLRHGFLPSHARAVRDALIRDKKLPKQRLNISRGSYKIPGKPQHIRYF